MYVDTIRRRRYMGILIVLIDCDSIWWRNDNIDSTLQSYLFLLCQYHNDKTIKKLMFWVKPDGNMRL